MKKVEWLPQKGDLVHLRQGFDRSFEAIAVRRAGLPLKEGALYEVVGSQDCAPRVVLKLREVRTLHVAGVQHIIDIGTEPFPYAADRFEAVSMPGSDRRVVRVRVRSRVAPYLAGSRN